MVIISDLSNEIPKGWKIAPLRWYMNCKSGDSLDTSLIEKEAQRFTHNIPVIGGNGIMGYSACSNIKNETISIGRVGALCGNVHYIDYKCWITDNSLFINRFKKESIDLKFFSYVLEQLNLNQFSTSTAQPLITGETIKRRKIALPPLSEQKKIVSYIQSKVAGIDALIMNKEKMLNLFEEKRQTMITEAVTKGLDPNVKMKDSGVEWVGEIPEHWDTISVRNLLRNNIIEYQDGNHGELHPISDDYIEEGIPFIMANNVRNNKLDLSHCKYISQERAEKLRIGFSVSGDVLLTHKGTVGEVAIVPDTLPSSFIMLTPQVTYYRINKSNIIKNVFLRYFFQSHSFKNQLKIISSMQSTRQYVGLVAQRELIVILPTIDEQQEIVKMISETEKPIKKIMADISLQIDKLKEYRQSLIYEAVTGKIDVRDFEVKA